MKKTRVFMTGATGNVGRAVLEQIDPDRFSVTLAVRDTGKAAKLFKKPKSACVRFDFEKQTGFDAIRDHDILFLLRPPQIGDVDKYVEPFLVKITEHGIPLTVFLSVQGADKKSYIPHSKIEKMIVAKGIPHVFLRPAYFMENLTTTLYDEIKTNHRIYLPSGRLKLNWIDTADIGSVCIKIFENSSQFTNRILTLTNTSNQSFHEIVSIINEICGSDIRYESPNVLAYILYMLRKNHTLGYIGVMLLLHFLPRFEKEPEIHDDIVKILNQDPVQISRFIEKNRDVFQKLDDH